MAPLDREREEMLQDAIPSFYLENAPDRPLHHTLMEIYDETFRYAEQVMDEALATMVPGRTPLLHTVPYFKVPVTKAWYGSAIAVSLGSRDFESQIRWLDGEGYYVPFAFGTNREAKLYALLLREAFDGQGELTLMEDYFIRDNKLYLLPEYMRRSTRLISHLHAFDIKIDLRMVERAWGGPFGIEPGPLLPRYEYRNTVEAYHHVMQSGGTIREINESIRKATGWERFKIEDRLSPGLDPGKKRMYDEMVISPATFLVTLPEELTKDKVRINVALGLVDSAKSPAKHYWFFVDVVRTETLEPEDGKQTKTRRRRTETGSLPDAKQFHARRLVQDEFFDVGRYDARERFDVEGAAGSFFDGQAQKSMEALVAPLNLVLESLGYADCPLEMGAFGEILDELTDRFNIRSEKMESESRFAYEVRRLKDVLRVTGNEERALSLKGYERFRYDVHHTKQARQVDDAHKTKDEASRNVVKVRTDLLHFTPGPVFSFDTNAKYDQGRLDSSVDKDIEHLTLDEDQLDERPNEAEYVQVTYHSFPEIPREFRREPYYSKTRLVVRPNDDGTEGFLLESSDDGVAWVEVERALNQPGSEKNPFTHEIDEAMARYYRVRAFAGEITSLPTLWLDATVLPVEEEE